MWSKAAIAVAMLAGSVTSASCAAPSGCLRALRAIEAGSIPAASDFARADCPQAQTTLAFHYDRHLRLARATRDIRFDEVVAGVPDFELPAIRPGQKIYVESRVGAVRVQREVEAIQPATKAQRVFVRAADGQVFAVPAPEGLP